MDPQNHTFEKIRSKVLTLLKNQRSSCKGKILAEVLQLLFSLYKLFILPKIPFKIILKIVEMPQNVEHLALPLNENAKFRQHFQAENILKVPIKGKHFYNLSVYLFCAVLL